MYEFARLTQIGTLRSAWLKVSEKDRAAGYDGIKNNDYAESIDVNLERLRFTLVNELYAPNREIQCHCKGRNISISTIEDRIVQTAIASILNENLSFPTCVHSFVEGRSIYTAHKDFRSKMYYSNSSRLFKLDIAAYFESIDPAILLKKISAFTSDMKFLSLIRQILATRKRGISTGSCLSPLLSNIYLMDFDTTLSKLSPIYIRYVDDMLVSDDISILNDPKDTIRNKIDLDLRDLKLTLNQAKSCTINPGDAFTWLGFDCRNGKAIESLLEQGDFDLAENLYQSQNMGEVDTAPTIDFAELSEDSSLLGFDAICYEKLFMANSRNLWVTTEEERYCTPESSATDIVAEMLIRNNKEFAIDVLSTDEKCDFTVFDIDINKKVILEHGDDSALFAVLLQKTHSLATSLISTVEGMGINAYLEFSGYKGFHVWVFWDESIPIDGHSSFKKFVISQLSIPEGIHIEVFPNSGDTTERIKLPYSTNSLSGKQSRFISPDEPFEILEDDSEPNYRFINDIVLSKFHSSFATPNGEVLDSRVPCAHNQSTPDYILAIRKNCTLINHIIDKAENENFINFHERSALAFTYTCLGDVGRKYLHEVLSNCMDYNYDTTQKHLSKHDRLYPIGCKKLKDRFADSFPDCHCACHFTLPKMYPSPVCHAIMVDGKCYKPPKKQEQAGGFKRQSDNMRLDGIVSKFIELNKKNHDIKSQQHICREQLDLLFEKNDLNEIETDSGVITKIADQYFIRLG